MRKIQTKEEIESKKKRNQIVLGVIMIGLMVISTAGYAFFSGVGSESGPESKIEYNGIEFIRQSGGFWTAKTNTNYNLETYYNPKETEDIQINININDQTFIKKPLYFVQENNNPEASYEILKNLYPLIERSQMVCLQGENCGDIDMIKKDCSDNVIIFKEAVNTTTITKNGGCIRIEAPYSEQIRVSDKLIFKIFGIQ